MSKIGAQLSPEDVRKLQVLRGSAPGGDVPRRFYINRKHDVSGVSGTGLVAWGTQYPDGTVSLRWTSTRASSVFFDCIEDVGAIHGHGTASEIVFIDA